jgi:hypothetical protein
MPGVRFQSIKDGGAVTLAPALPEAAVEENDPAQALLSAQADGLLNYHGFVSGNRYEVDAHGRHWTMPAADALLTVARLRAVEQLSRSGALVQLREIRNDGAYVIGSTQGDVILPEQDVIHWCAGYLAAQNGNGQSHTGTDTIGEIADLIETPNLDDQCRMVILGLMYGGPELVTAEKLAERIGSLPGVTRTPVKKTIVSAIAFGKGLSADMREVMIRAFGLRWSVSAVGGPCENAEGKPTGSLPEMPGLARLRELVAASRDRRIRYLDRPEPNRARWLQEYKLAVGKQQYVVTAEALMPWLDGVEAFHGTASAPNTR